MTLQALADWVEGGASFHWSPAKRLPLAFKTPASAVTCLPTDTCKANPKEYQTGMPSSLLTEGQISSAEATKTCSEQPETPAPEVKQSPQVHDLPCHPEVETARQDPRSPEANNDGSVSRSCQNSAGHSSDLLQAVALAAVFHHQQASALLASRSACKRASADVAAWRQTAKSKEAAALQSQQSTASLLTIQKDLQSEIQKGQAILSAQEAFARQAEAAAREAADQNYSLQYAKDQAVAQGATLQHELSGCIESLKQSEAASAAATAECADLKAQLHTMQRHLSAQQVTQERLQHELDQARVSRDKASALSAADCAEAIMAITERQRLQQELDQAKASAPLPASVDEAQMLQKILVRERAVSKQLVKDNEVLQQKLKLARASTASITERSAAAASVKEAEKLRQQLLQEQAASRQLQEEVTAAQLLGNRRKSERDANREELARLAQAHAAADQTISSHWRASAARDAAIKDLQARLAAQSVQVITHAQQ